MSDRRIMKGVSIPGYRISKDGKVEADHAAREAKLDLCTRLKRKHSKKITVSRNPRPKAG
jgi:hypothetical protein